MTTIIRLGCTGKPGSFVAPYIYSLFPHDLGPYQYVVVIRAETKLRREPSQRGRVLETLHWDILEILDMSEPAGTWMHVRLASGLQGYVDGNSVRSPIDHRAFFGTREGQWTMTVLVAGD